MSDIPPEEVHAVYERLRNEAEASGYHLNPDTEFTKELIHGLLVNGKRYGYWACPCRLASGKKEEDLDIICPCDYRDADLDEYGTCYCSLYVSGDVVSGEKTAESIPERRSTAGERKKEQATSPTHGIPALSHPVWRCRVCGYLCARDGPPEVCPVCKANKERFERFM